MKSIVIINTPSSCEDCDCQFDHVCVLKDIDLEEMNSVPKWCPLRPMPKKDDGKLTEYCGDWGCGYADGWNTCLKEIENG